MRAEMLQASNGIFSDVHFPSDDDLVNSSSVNSSIKIPSEYLKNVAGTSGS